MTLKLWNLLLQVFSATTSHYLGMLSKSRGHVLRLATVMHFLFHIDDLDKELEAEVSDSAIRAAVNFIEVSSQQTAFIAGRSIISDELAKFQAGEYR